MNNLSRKEGGGDLGPDEQTVFLFIPLFLEYVFTVFYVISENK